MLPKTERKKAAAEVSISRFMKYGYFVSSFPPLGLPICRTFRRAYALILVENSSDWTLTGGYARSIASDDF